jgi:uncharacterized protein
MYHIHTLQYKTGESIDRNSDMKRVILVLLMVLSWSPLLAFAEDDKSYKAVFHMNVAQGSDWGAMIRNINNLQTALEGSGDLLVAIVFHGPGLGMLLKTNTSQQAALQALADKGVEMAACQNTMQGMNLTADDLFEFAVEVDSGVAELVRKQHQGWAYIKP